MNGLSILRIHLPLLLVLAAATNLAAAQPELSAKAIVDARNRMVDEEIVAAGVKDPRVIDSMRSTPRHEFVGAKERANAYFDMALPIGEGQTISPPFIVAYMTEQLLPQPGDKVLEIGTGSGYQAAVLCPLVKEVYTIEIVKPLGERAARALKRLKYTNVHAKIGDGYQGWPEHAPFDKIIVTCSPEKVPPKLVEQLREGGRMLVPVGERYQQALYLFEKKAGKLTSAALLPMLFVPMTGAAEAGREILPDPENPQIGNGGFEEIVHLAGEVASNTTARPKNTDEPSDHAKPSGWHYQRQLQLVTAKDAPEGDRYVLFANTEPGRASRAMQGLAVDGRKVSELEILLKVRAKNVTVGTSKDELPLLGITFYDERRGEAKPGGYLGPWRGTFDWQTESETIKVPPNAREAIVRIGLHGATGEISFDDVQIKAVKKK